MREFFVNRLGGKGHNDATGLARSEIAKSTREQCEHERKEREPPSMSSVKGG